MCNGSEEEESGSTEKKIRGERGANNSRGGVSEVIEANASVVVHISSFGALRAFEVPPPAVVEERMILQSRMQLPDLMYHPPSVRPQIVLVTVVKSLTLSHHKIAYVKKRGYPLEWQVRLDATIYLRTSGDAI